MFVAVFEEIPQVASLEAKFYALLKNFINLLLLNRKLKMKDSTSADAKGCSSYY